MKYTITAVIPTGQYANIQPSIEVETDTFEEAYNQAMPHIEKISQQYAEEGKALKGNTTGFRVKMKAFVGGYIWYDKVAHQYTNEAGEVYLSGSAYAKQFDKPFDGEAIAKKMEAKSGIPASTILDIWKLKGNASASFGTAIHEALEMYGKYSEASKTLEKEYHQSAIPIVKQIVDDFFKGRENEKAVYEPMIVDNEKKWAGQIDRLLLVDEAKKLVRVQDYKTNTDLTDQKKMVYGHQLDFYSEILEAGGYTVQGTDIFWFDGSKWETISKERK